MRLSRGEPRVRCALFESRAAIDPARAAPAIPALQAFHGIRSERQIIERLEYDLLFRWFVGLGIDEATWDQTIFSKNRDRLLAGDVAARFMAEVLGDQKVRRLPSSEHFSVDTTLIEAWASLKSFRQKDGSDEPPAPGQTVPLLSLPRSGQPVPPTFHQQNP
jgi:transposase